ncbi:expressed protein [Batrachochytrium dendrobatidis JAM81]|uniref:Expressed protein n=2 Tax=Batrachochytrium dendrobatidis TaxID=109871 RepID=F4NVH4_BATDJ|nr:uncharacterized protein BATDEDRAFT_34085 [Batrachochytrium dendrobatidis JAM81]EGF84095.1 expressed protein [Batrachochytrium dendrobatidis JAM81]KAJ8325531.1 hypothetical protein O5D80_005746 [Batrachochytrium dendrobatidis]KAK5671488.1 hypothetical protein QVD99_002194 [Batrachochytrium dendrobatidis]OAJ36591.1 hypothetical protein BDEG_20753 [Batrachochytrium dendrobatidis JEL423]|eukprot:XP_006675745.1 expressed protein [Batrachochytrium dendrobatidis JAM81]
MEQSTLIYAAIFFIAFISNSVFTGGISDQAQYGLGGVCLLFIDHYRYDDSIKANVFSAYSNSCSIAISVGSFGFLALFLLAAAHFWFVWKKEQPSKRVVYLFAMSASVMAFIFFITAAVVSAGLSQTCSQFSKVEQFRTCANVFSDGFFADTVAKLYSKNLTTISAAAGAGWMMCISWTALAIYDWVNYRVSANKWW